jgi:outer membrane scaffolding protein for murein synthesis (MipA/OmpV family)
LTRAGAIIALAGVLLPMTTAWAANLASSSPDPGSPLSGYVVTLGAGFEIGPRLGAKRYGFTPVPSIDIREADEPAGFSSPQDNLDYAFVDTARFSAGPVMGLREGRDKNDLPKTMNGIAYTPTMLEIGGFAELWVAPETLRTRIELRHGVHANDGLVADLSADIVSQSGPVTISGGPRLTAASRNVMQRNFGVSASGAAANGQISPFSPEAGVQSAGVGAALRYAATPIEAVTLYGHLDRLIGDAAKSPVTRSFGSPNQKTVGLSYERSFSFGQ